MLIFRTFGAAGEKLSSAGKGEGGGGGYLHQSAKIGDILLESVHSIESRKGIGKEALRIVRLHVALSRNKVVDGICKSETQMLLAVPNSSDSMHSHSEVIIASCGPLKLLL